MDGHRIPYREPIVVLIMALCRMYVLWVYTQEFWKQPRISGADYRAQRHSGRRPLRAHCAGPRRAKGGLGVRTLKTDRRRL